jgi:DNA-binding GntR family transcriptional regulator
MFDYLTEDRVQATIAEHIQIAERILDGDLVAGRKALTAHIEGSRNVAIDRASRALSMAGIVMALRT